MAIEEFYMDLLVVPQSVSVRSHVYADMLKVVNTASVYYSNSLKITISTRIGYIDILIDDNMPEEMDFYVGDSHMHWLDRLAEDILLRGL
jgi:hypothetical protein